MKVIISTRNKLDIFIALFQLFKNWSSQITMLFKEDGLYIQSMDKSHICLSKVFIEKDWFLSYEYKEETKICVDTSHFYSIMNYGSDHEQIHLESEDCDADKLFINFINNKNNTDSKDNKDSKDKKVNYDHFFEISLIDIEEDIITIPSVQYDVEFIIETKKLNELLNELETFGSIINIHCNEEVLEFLVSDDRSKLKININIDDLDEFIISEGENIDTHYNLLHLHKMSISQKLSKTVNIAINQNYPILIKYNLGGNSFASFYVAPKVIM